MRYKIGLIFLGLVFNQMAYGQVLNTDLGEIADKASCLESLSQETKKTELLIFVSFSMPVQSLQLWSQQAEKIGGVLVLRGLVDNSFQATTQKTLKLFSDAQVGGFSIDPEKFQQYKIKQVPAVVLTIGENHDVVYGDTSLESALDYIARHGSDFGKKQANDYLKLGRKHQ